MRTYYQVTAELYTEHVVPIINGKQYDTGRGVLITLTDAGAVVVPDALEQLRLYCKKPDGTVSYLPGTLSGSAVSVDLTNQVQAVPGIVECELQIGTGADMVTTPVFRLLVMPSNYNPDAVESSDEFTALDAALATVQQYDSRIQQNADDITALDGRMIAAETELAKFGTDSRTATTTNTGNFSLSTQTSARIVLAAWMDGAYMCIPFTESTGAWYVKVLSWNGTTYAPLLSTSVTVTYLYRAV